MREPLIHVDLFAGPGGFACGLRAAGWTTATAVEMVRTCVETYRRNFSGVPVIHRDIREVSGGEVARFLPSAEGRRRQADLVTAGVPCETHSTAGTKSRNTYDHRQWLYKDAIRIARAVRAKVLVFENVKQIRTKTVREGAGELLIDAIRRDLADAGYLTQREFVLVASEFGVPQHRERWFMIAARDDLDIVVPGPPGVRTTVRDAFIDLPPDLGACGYLDISGPYSRLMRDRRFWRASGAGDVLTQHEGPRHRASTVARHAMVPRGGRLWDLYEGLEPATLARLQAHGVVPAVPFKQKGQRLPLDRPSPTLTSHSEGELVHPARNRCLSVRESARLQSFPDSTPSPGRSARPTRARTRTCTSRSATRCRPCWHGASAWRCGGCSPGCRRNGTRFRCGREWGQSDRDCEAGGRAVHIENDANHVIPDSRTNPDPSRLLHRSDKSEAHIRPSPGDTEPVACTSSRTRPARSRPGPRIKDVPVGPVQGRRRAPRAAVPTAGAASGAHKGERR